MNKAITRLFDGIGRANQLLALLGVFVSFLLVGLVVHGVIVRYIFRSPTALSIELSEQLFVVVIALALAYTQMNGKHVRVEMLTSHLHGKLKDVLDITSHVFILVYCAIVFWALQQRFVWYYERGIATDYARVPYAPFSLVIAIGMGVLGLQIAIETMKLLAGVFKGHKGVLEPGENKA